MNRTMAGMVAAALLLLFIAFLQGGFSLVGRGFWAAGQTFLQVFPLLIVAFIVAGLVNVLVTKKMVAQWLGEKAGWKGPFLGALLGALVPGGPFFFYPLMATLIVSGANIGTMISFVAAKTLWFVGRIPLEIAFVGLEITVARFLITFAVPILTGGAVNVLLPGIAVKIKEEVEGLQAKNRVEKKAEKSGEKND